MSDPIFNFCAFAKSIKILVFSCSHVILGFKDIPKKQTNKKKFQGTFVFSIMANLSAESLFRVNWFVVQLRDHFRAGIICGPVQFSPSYIFFPHGQKASPMEECH